MGNLTSPGSSKTRRQRMDDAKDPLDRKLKSYIETTYSPIPRDEQERIIDNVISLIELAQDKKQNSRSIMDHVAKMIFRLFSFDEIAVGLRDRRSGVYRYEVLFGYRKEVIDKFRRIEYSYHDMVSYDRFPNVKIGRLSEFNPVEGLPEREKDLYDRPLIISQKRTGPDDFHEGDYIDVWMYDYRKDLIGWIELSRPRSGKLPPRMAIRWIELIASISASIVAHRWAEEDLGRKI